MDDVIIGLGLGTIVWAFILHPAVFAFLLKVAIGIILGSVIFGIVASGHGLILLIAIIPVLLFIISRLRPQEPHHKINVVPMS